MTKEISKEVEKEAQFLLDYITKSDEYVGFVGIPLDRQETISLVQLLSQRIVGGVLPDHVITAMFGDSASRGR